MERKRRRRKHQSRGLLLALTGVFILLLAGGIGFGIYKFVQSEKRPAAEEYLTQFTELLKQGNYEEMYGFLSEQAKTQVSLEEFCGRYQAIYDGMEAANIRISIDSTDEERKERLEAEAVPYTVTMDTLAGEVSFKITAILVENEEKEYVMNWDTQDIFPDLKEGDKVKVITTESRRGNIYDRDGNALAHEGVASSVGIVPGKLLEPREEQLAAIAALLEVTPESIEKKLGAAWVKDDYFVPVRTVSKEAYELKEQLLLIPGVMINDTALRYYPLGKMTAHFIGYVQNITAEELEERKGQRYNADSIIGKAGLERIYEDVLRGQDGYSIQIVDADGNLKSVVLESQPQNGEDITLTISSTLQRYLYQELDGDNGCAAAINPLTGEVLAMVSTPAYDGNDFVMGYTASAWDAVNKDENQPLYNRVRGTWVPGSSFKPVVAAMALTAGTLDPAQDVANDGLSWQPDSSWGSYHVTTLVDYPVKNLKNALINSDNIYFAKAAVGIGIDKFTAGLNNLGFGAPVDFEIEFNASSYGSEGIKDSLMLANSGYGQAEMLVNPLHLSAIYSAFVNDGNMIKPTLILGKEPVYMKEQVFTQAAAAEVMEDLIAIVEDENGTARDMKIDGITIGGKTGTAELKATQDDTTGTELGWFVGMTDKDAEKPLLITMMIEDVKGRGGSHYVTPKVRAAFSGYYGLGNQAEEILEKSAEGLTNPIPWCYTMDT